MARKKSTKQPKLYGLSKQHTRKYARDFNDIDYAADLSPAEREWLDRFCREYYQHAFRNDGKDLHPRGSDERRRCSGRDNERRRDMWTQMQRAPNDFTDTTDFGADDDKDKDR